LAICRIRWPGCGRSISPLNVGVALPTQSTTLSTTTLPSGATAVTETVNPNVLLWSFALEYTLLTHDVLR